MQIPAGLIFVGVIAVILYFVVPLIAEALSQQWACNEWSKDDDIKGYVSNGTATEQLTPSSISVYCFKHPEVMEKVKAD